MEQELVEYDIYGNIIEILKEMNTPYKETIEKQEEKEEEYEEDDEDKENREPGKKLIEKYNKNNNNNNNNKDYQQWQQTPLKVNGYEQYLSQSFNTAGSTNHTNTNSHRTPLQDITMQTKSIKKHIHKTNHSAIQQEVRHFKFFR